MKHKRLQFSAILLLCFGLISLQAQESLNATGGNASGNGGSASYSVGQFVYTTHIGTNGSVAQGVQQAFQISEVTGIEDAKDVNLTVSAYPNPTTDYLQLKVEREKLKDLSYQLFDMNGKLLQNRKLTGIKTQIDMSVYVPSIYFVRVISGGKSIKEFKIIKN
jgi:hypothetical protein